MHEASDALICATHEKLQFPAVVQSRCRPTQIMDVVHFRENTWVFPFVPPLHELQFGDRDVHPGREVL
jgi:hypothetical protein